MFWARFGNGHVGVASHGIHDFSVEVHYFLVGVSGDVLWLIIDCDVVERRVPAGRAFEHHLAPGGVVGGEGQHGLVVEGGGGGHVAVDDVVLRGIGVAVDSGVVVPVHQVVGAVGHGLDDDVGTGHHGIGGVGHDGADAVGVGGVGGVGGATDEGYLADVGGACGDNNLIGVAFPHGAGGVDSPAVLVVPRINVGVRNDHLDAAEVAVGASEGDAAREKPLTRRKDVSLVAGREGDAVSGVIMSKDKVAHAVAPNCVAAQLDLHVAAVVVDEGEGVGSEDHSGEVGAVVGHDAAVVDQIDGAGAGAFDSNGLGEVGVAEAHHVGVAGTDAEDKLAYHHGISPVVDELLVGGVGDFHDGVHLEAVVGADDGVVRDDSVVVGPGQLGAVLGEGGGDGLVLRHGEGGGAVEVVDDGAGSAAPAHKVVVHLGRGLDVDRGAGDDKVLAFGGGGDDAVAAGGAVDLNLGDTFISNIFAQVINIAATAFAVEIQRGRRGGDGVGGIVIEVEFVSGDVDAFCGREGYRPALAFTVLSHPYTRFVCRLSCEGDGGHVVEGLAAAGEAAAGVDGSQQGALAAQQDAHGAHVVVVGREGEGGGLGDGDGEEGGVVLVVVVAVEDCVEGGCAGAYGLEAFAIGVADHSGVGRAVAQGGAAGGGVVEFSAVAVVVIHRTPLPCISSGFIVKGTTFI